MREADLRSSDEFTSASEGGAPRQRQVPKQMPSSMQDYGVFGRLKPGNTDGDKGSSQDVGMGGVLEGTDANSDRINGNGMLGGPQHHQVRLLGTNQTGDESLKRTPSKQPYTLEEDDFNRSAQQAQESTSDRAQVPAEQPSWARPSSDLESDADEEENESQNWNDGPTGLNPSAGVSFLHKGSAFSYTGERIRRPGENSSTPITPPIGNADKSPNINGGDTSEGLALA